MPTDCNRDGIQLSRGDEAWAHWHLVVLTIAVVMEHQARELPDRRIAREDMEVDMSVHVLEKRVVEVVNGKRVTDSVRRLHGHHMQRRPLVRFELRQEFAVTTEDDHRLAEKALFAVQDHPPPPTFVQQWLDGRQTQATLSSHAR
jgi:hypothetical protein